MKNVFTLLVNRTRPSFFKNLLLLAAGVGWWAPLPAVAMNPAITVVATPAANWVAGPVFTTKQYSFTISDKSQPGTSIGKVQAVDSDKYKFKYFITGGNINQAFALDQTTGTVTLAKRLNYHTQNNYQLTIQVKDASSRTDEATLAIAVSQETGTAEVSKITWSSVASQPYIFYEGQGKVVNNKWYLFSGFDALKGFTPTSRAYRYDPDANKFTPIAPMPAMNGTNYGGITHTGFATDETDIYFAGGYTANRSGNGQIFGTKEVWKYIVAEDRYVRLPDLPRVSAAGQLEYLRGKLHYIAGTDRRLKIDIGDHFVLDVDNLAAGWDTLAPLPSPRQHAGSAVYGGKIYFIAGQTGHDEGSVSTRLVHVYDPATDAWTRVADIPAPAGTPGVAHISSSVVVLGNQIIVLGGEYAFTRGLRRVSAYTPATNTWTDVTGLPMVMRGGVGGILNGKIYYTGGKGVKATVSGVPVSNQTVTQLTLVNAENGADIRSITAQDTLNLATLPTRKLSIRATTNPGTVGSVVFQLSGKQAHTQTETKAPYSLMGETLSNKYQPWTPEVGAYSLKVTPYDQGKGNGLGGATFTANFLIIDSLVTNLKSNTPHSYAIKQLTAGVPAYSDRDFQVLTIPPYLQNATFIQTPNEDKLNTETGIFTFDLNNVATVYVAYDSRATRLPAWLSNWQKLPEQVEINSPKNKNMVLYSKTFAAGKMSLSGNRATPASGALNNYFVIIAEQTRATIPVALANLPDQNTQSDEKLPFLNAYPNPKQVGEKINVEIGNVGQQEKVLITLHDLTGHTVLTQTLVTDTAGKLKTEVPLSENVKSGLYLLQIQTPSGKQQVKIFVP